MLLCAIVTPQRGRLGHSARQQGETFAPPSVQGFFIHEPNVNQQIPSSHMDIFIRDSSYLSTDAGQVGLAIVEDAPLLSVSDTVGTCRFSLPQL